MFVVPTLSPTLSPTTISPTFTPTPEPIIVIDDSLGVCETSGDSGYEVEKYFKIRIKDEDDEKEKDTKTQQYIDDIINENSHCDDYSVQIDETWVRTKRMQVTITICFHCPDLDDSAYIEQDNSTSVNWSEITNWLLFCIICIIIIWILCCILVCIKYQKHFKSNNICVDNKIIELPRLPSESNITPMTIVSQDDEEEYDSDDPCIEFAVTTTND